MKLKEFLMTLDQDKHIKIGAKDGSKFFYVGSPADMLNSFNRNRKKYREYDAAIIASLDNALIRLEFAAQKLYRITETDEKASEKLLDRLYRTNSRYSETKEYRQRYVNLANRNVLDCFESDPIADEGTTAIIIDGKEFGQFWTYDEGDRGMSGIMPTLKIANMGGDM